MRLLVDTSVLVRLRDADSQAHSVCIEAIERLRAQSAELCIGAQVLIEFWSVSTRPREVNGMGRSIEETYQDCGLFLQVFRLLDEPADIAHRWLQLALQHQVRGRQVHDARLAAFALAHQMDYLLTLNPQDFARFQELTVRTPEEFLSV